MSKTVYLDTTILSFLFDERKEIRFLIEVTKEWWNNYKKYYDVFLSEETLNELYKGNYPKKNSVLKTAVSIDILPYEKEIKNIAQVYIDNYLLPSDLSGDSFHLAYASYYKMDFLLTWNYKHLANGNKKQHIRIINNRLGLYVPEIITPLELLNKGED